MPGGGSAVKVKGLVEFRRACKKLDSNLAKTIRVALNACSTFLIEHARPLVPTVTGKAARSMKARSSQDTVRVAVGGKMAPYYPWLDYGGNVGKNNTAHRPFITDGRYLYPTLRKHRDEFDAILRAGLADVAEAAGLDLD